jgi:molybdopterin-guanine dinucleotide biosynthesis protein A
MNFQENKKDKEDCCALKNPLFGAFEAGKFHANKHREWVVMSPHAAALSAEIGIEIQKISAERFKRAFTFVAVFFSEEAPRTEIIDGNTFFYTPTYTPKNVWENRITAAKADLVLLLGAHFMAENRVEAHLSEPRAIAEKIMENWVSPTLKGLVLAGGHSRRMGADKTQLRYGKNAPQAEHVTQMLTQSLGLETYLSCRSDQVLPFENLNPLPDSFLEMGPMGGILSAFLRDPTAAWLVVACDLPLLSLNMLQNLIENRVPSAIATAYKSPNSAEGFPEPLVALWEPKAFSRLLAFLGQGVMCPRKVLINSNTALLEPTVSDPFFNANTPDDRQKALEKIGA